LIAAIHGHSELAGLLIESSISGHTPEPIDVDCKDQSGLTPLNCCAIKGDFPFVQLLIEKVETKVKELLGESKS
jgi:ankyrin repeat protein